MKLGSKGSIKNVGGQNAEAETANPNQPAPLEIEEEILIEYAHHNHENPGRSGDDSEQEKVERQGMTSVFPRPIKDKNTYLKVRPSRRP